MGRGERFFGLRPQNDRLGCGIGMAGRVAVSPSGRKGDPAWPPAENRRGILASVILSEAKDLFSDGALYTGEILRAFRTTGADDPAVAGAARRGERFFGLRPQNDRMACGLRMTGWAAASG